MELMVASLKSPTRQTKISEANPSKVTKGEVFQKIFGKLTQEQLGQETAKSKGEPASGTLGNLVKEALLSEKVAEGTGEEAETLQVQEILENLTQELGVDAKLEEPTEELLALVAMMGINLPIKLQEGSLEAAAAQPAVIPLETNQQILPEVKANAVETLLKPNQESLIEPEASQNSKHSLVQNEPLTKESQLPVVDFADQPLMKLPVSLSEQLLPQELKLTETAETAEALPPPLPLAVEPATLEATKVSQGISKPEELLIQPGKLESVTSWLGGFAPGGVANKKSSFLGVQTEQLFGELGLGESKLKSTAGISLNSAFTLPLIKEVPLKESLPVNGIGQLDLSGFGLNLNEATEETELFKLPLTEETVITKNETSSEFPNLFLEQFAKTETIANEVITKPETSAGVTAKEILPQIIEQTHRMVANGYHEMEVSLQPEHLGKLQVKISLENQLVTAHFLAESEQVKEIIETSLNQLRQKLQETGLRIDQLQVNVGGQGSGSNYQQQYYTQADYFLNQSKERNSVSRVESVSSTEVLATRPAVLTNGAIDFVA